jgi:hypothetical protein
VDLLQLFFRKSEKNADRKLMDEFEYMSAFCWFGRL